MTRTIVVTPVHGDSLPFRTWFKAKVVHVAYADLGRTARLTLLVDDGEDGPTDAEQNEYAKTTEEG